LVFNFICYGIYIFELGNKINAIISRLGQN